MGTNLEITQEELKAMVAEATREAVEKALEKLPKPEDNKVKEPTPPPPVPEPAPVVKATDETRVQRRAELEYVLRALAAARGNLPAAVDLARRAGYPEHLVKAIQWSVDANGGYLAPPEYASELIELLREQAIFMRARPVEVSLATGREIFTGIAGGAVAEYKGENEAGTITGLTFRQIQMSIKELFALVPISNRALRYSAWDVQTVVTNDLAAAMALRFDAAAIRDNGTAPRPKGLRYWAPAGNVVAANATIDAATVEADLYKLIGKLEDAHVRMLRPAWLFSRRTKRFLLQLKNSMGLPVFKEEMQDNSTLLGIPWLATSVIPDNLGGTGNESEVYLADFADVVVGTGQNLSIDFSGDATYVSGGNVYSAFQQGMTLLRAVWEHDVAVRHEESVAVLTGVKWGA
jgi:HK97 family phage major capsid protein